MSRSHSDSKDNNTEDPQPSFGGPHSPVSSETLGLWLLAGERRTSSLYMR